MRFEAEWYGSIGMTANALPRFHRLDRNVLAFSGYNGRGIAPGTVFGQVLAAHILGRLEEAALPLPIAASEQASFKSVRETFYGWGAQAAHLVDARF